MPRRQKGQKPECVAKQTQYPPYMVIIYVKLTSNDRSCCDLDLQGSSPNVARDMSSQNGDYFCEIVSKSDFK